MTNIEQPNGDESPFPTAADMDLDLWRASLSVHPQQHFRTIEGVANTNVAYILGVGQRDSQRDSTTRRIEMMGELYDELRKLVDKVRPLGVDIVQAEEVLNEFVAPKPFPEVV
jgi:hypothetical protein